MSHRKEAIIVKDRAGKAQVRPGHGEVELCGHGKVAAMVTAHAADSGCARQCKWVEEVHEEQASLWTRAIGLRWQGDGEFLSAARGARRRRRREKERQTWGARHFNSAGEFSRHDSTCLILAMQAGACHRVRKQQTKAAASAASRLADCCHGEHCSSTETTNFPSLFL